MYHDWKTCETIARTLMGMRIAIIEDYGFAGMAALNLLNQNIIVNPKTVEEHLKKVFPNGVPGDVKTYFSIFLTLHEVGHYFYSPTYEELMDACKRHPDIEGELQAFCSNVVEDCVIQRAMEKRFPSKKFKKAWATGTPIMQGEMEAKDYIDTLDPNNVHGMLFYFILRAYNIGNADVQSRWNNNPKLPWSDKTIALFDTSITTVNRLDRVDQSVGEFAKSVYDDLLQRGLNPPPGPGQGPQGPGGQGGQGGGQGQGPSQPGQGSGQGSGSGQGKDPQNGQGQGQGQNQGNSQGKGGTGAGAPTGRQQPLTKDQIDAAIKQAAAELNKQLNGDTATQQKRSSGADSSDPGPINKSIDGVDNRQLEDIDADITSDIQVGTTDAESDKRYGKLNILGEELYKTIVPIFGRIHNEEPYWQTGLEEGEEIDQDALPDFFTQKDLHIYKDFHSTKENRKINVTFFLDDSGSMDGSLFVNCANILAALCHAFEETEIDTQIYLFGSSSRKVKDLSMHSYLSGNVSNVLSALNQAYEGGGTSIKDGLKHYIQQETFNDDEYINLIFILTDGCIWDTAEAAKLIADLQSRKVYINGIGLNLGDGDVRNFKQWCTNVKNYSPNEILKYLGDDIADFIDDIIHGKK